MVSFRAHGTQQRALRIAQLQAQIAQFVAQPTLHYRFSIDRQSGRQSISIRNTGVPVTEFAAVVEPVYFVFCPDTADYIRTISTSGDSRTFFPPVSTGLLYKEVWSGALLDRKMRRAIKKRAILGFDPGSLVLVTYRDRLDNRQSQLVKVTRLGTEVLTPREWSATVKGPSVYLGHGQALGDVGPVLKQVRRACRSSPPSSHFPLNNLPGSNTVTFQVTK
jgi:hypothetical protein